ncbi:xanthine dehydrogenase family protein subunit M [Desulfovibrio aerotolerans]|uniref:Xanthine dehydrogenase family protein subunit M n=1 Tax=Solidesulfovibrio aerotolerans TaxID=295255 RepID=A0A7C9ITF1_9BACT|nr:xanthine dehydrogenase family protein subunit M [Solidesulfovibrio aerotolerans]
MIGAVYCPTSLEALWPLLADGAHVLAGGTDLLVAKRGPASCAVALLEGIGELAGISEGDGLIRLGAMASHATLARHPLVRQHLAVLALALETLGSPPIRAMGTLGGNIATASPAGDTLPALLALNARLELASAKGRRVVPLADFLLGPGRTALAAGEIIAAVVVAPPAPAALQHFEKIGRRDALAIAVASLAAVIATDAAGTVTEARLAVGSLAPTARRLPAAEAALTGQRLNRESLTRAAAAIREAVSPMTDVRASAAYRRQAAGNLLLRLTPQP